MTTTIKKATATTSKKDDDSITAEIPADLIDLDNMNKEAEIPEVKEIDFPYNKKTIESYEANGFEIPDNVEGRAEKVFLHLANLEQGPIEREVTRIVRIKSRDFDSGSKMAWKEYVYWFENWKAKTWLGEPLLVADHVEGKYYEQEKRTEVPRDMKTGRLLPARSKRCGQHEMFYVPFSKEKADEIIGERDKDSIVYTIKFPAGVSGGNGIRNNFSYQHFLLPLEEAFKLNAKAGGSSMNPLTAANAIRSDQGIT